MRKLYLLLPALALTIVVGSCSSGGDEETPTDTSGQPATEQAAPPAATAPASTPDPAPTAEAEDEGQPSDILTGISLNPVFIPSTDPDARRNATAEGRTDPFADIAFSPTVVFAPEPPPEPVTPPQNVPSVPRVTPQPAPAPTNSNANASGNVGNGNNNASLVSLGADPTGSSVSSTLDFSPVLPAAPIAQLAEETQVTGIIQLNGVDNIMVKAPNEEFSRYVQVGDFIADGQVKVKRVDFRRNSPVVVLEQLGIEVYKEIEDVLLADRSGSQSTGSEVEASEG
ncbi:hypothetical protein [[Limnothrix rosea] IAM M-220]|uniref:hypothetical protein n=1 Tax=[Limnothrix rosea] IAM M-220 TaxID=454133 RepID=UPI0009637C30|nr:hypothetical protein [[Limnothrix rosea] IAM M-220]OKH18176.1 hypothetical protein NIES208_06535 [[Limnothrix rosea] IAM M-220]